METLWKYLTSLPTMLSFTLIVLVIAAVVLIALKGRFKAKIGDKEVDIGENGSKNGKECEKKDTKSIPLSIPKPPPTVTLVQKRSCGDCVLIMMGEREKYEISMRHEVDHILKTQMNYAEQKLVEIQTILVNAYSNKLFENKAKIEGSESVQHKLFYGLIRDTLLLVKDEIRRSFKDNGFYELKDSDFNSYVKDKMRVLISMMQQHLRNIYPDSGTILSVYDVLKILEDNYSRIESIVFDTYASSKEVKTEAGNRIDSYKQAFSDWVNKFILK